MLRPFAQPAIPRADPAPCEVIERENAAPVLVVCDHASNALPAALGTLGMSHADLGRHIAWDIGAGEVARRLAAHLDACAILGGYSRLLIDCNRQPGDPTSIPTCSDGVPVPGNAGLADDVAEWRLEAYFWPYHHAITNMLAKLWRHGAAPALIAVHSFTPMMNGRDRPWHAGVLWNRDPRMAVPLIRNLGREPGLLIGDNEPYSGREIGYTIDTHAGAAGLPHVSVEIRQDLVEDEAGAERWAILLADALRPILAEAGLHRVEQY